MRKPNTITDQVPTTEPLQSDISAVLSGQSYFDCGAASDLSFGGVATYTLEAWIKPSAVDNGYIVGKASDTGKESSMFISDGLATSYRSVTGGWVIQSQTVLQAGQWYHVATTYDGATLSLYVNGTLEASASVPSQGSFPGVSTTIGGSGNDGFFQGQIYEVRIWNVCRTADQILDSMDEVGPASEGLVADFAFWTIPPTDVSFNTHPVTPVGTVGNMMESGALLLQNGAYVNCFTTPDLSLGGFVPYTLEGWIYLPTVSGSQTILSKFNGGVAAEYGFWVENGVVVSYRNVAPWGIRSQTVLQPNQWYHVATTYDGATLSLYINGTLETSSPFTSQPGFPSVPTLIGALYLQNQLASFFQGYIQDLRMWRLALTQDQIAYAMSQVPSFADVALIANFDFTVTPASDVTGNHALQLMNGATLTTLQQSVTSTNPPALRTRAPEAGYVAKPAVVPLSPEHVRVLVDEFRTALGTSIGSDERERRTADYAQLIERLIEQVQASPESVGPHVQVVRDGDRYLLRAHVNGELRHELVLNAAAITPYQIWLATFTLTLITGALDVFLSIKYNKGTLELLYDKIMGNATVMQQVQACIAAGATATSVLGVIDGLYQTGLLKMLLQWALSFWQIFTALWTLAQYLVPGLKQAALFVKIASLVIKLAQMLQNIPSVVAESLSFDEAPALVMA